MQCINCGQELNDDQKFCNKCGKFQPLANIKTDTKTRPFFANLSIIMFVISLMTIPILFIGIIALLIAGKMSNSNFLVVLIQLIKLFFFVSGIPLLISLICKIISKKKIIK